MAKDKQRKSGEDRLPQAPRLKDWQAALVIVVVVAFFFRDVILQKAFFWEDFLYFFYPIRNLAAVSMAGGELPLWNPFTFSGMPFQADIQSALFYVPNLLLTFFVSGGILNFYWVELQIILHYMIAGMCMYYLAKSYGLTGLPALFSGLVFSLSGFMIVHAIHQVIICQVAWFPLIVLLFRKSMLQKSLLHMILAGFVLGHAVMAGFPQVTLYIFLFLFFFFLFEFFSSVAKGGLKSSIPLVPLAAGMVIIALGLTALQLLPTQELAPLSQRAEISYSKSLEGSISYGRLITLLIPKFYGVSDASGSTFWLPKPYWEYWETSFYMGIAIIVLMVFAAGEIRKNRNVAFYFAVIAFALLYALGDDFILHKFFFFNVPGFDKFRNPARMSLWYTFAASILSGFALQRIMDTVSANAKKFRQTLLVTLGVGFLIWLSAQMGAFQPPGNSRTYAEIHNLATSEATVSLVFFLLVSGVLFFWSRRTISGMTAIAIVFILQIIDMNLFGFSQNNSVLNPADYYGRTRDMVSFIREDSGTEYVRVNSRKENAMLLDRNQGMVDRIFLMEGYTPLSLQRIFPPAKDWDGVCDLLNAKYRIVLDAKQRSMHLSTASTYLKRAFVVFDAKVIPDDTQLKAYMASDSFNPKRTVVLAEDPGFKTGDSSATGSANITSYRMNSISLDVDCSADGYLVMSEIYYPGWKAYVDGAERTIYRADWSLRATPLEAGSHKVEMKFEPDSFYRGIWISLGTIGLSAAGIVFSVVSRKRKTAPAS